MHFANLLAGGPERPRTFAGLTAFAGHSLMFLAVGMTTTSVLAADDATPQRRAGGIPRQLLEKFDANQDGELDESERAKAREAFRGQQRRGGFNRAELVKKFDKDGDGQLNERERQAAMQAMRAQAGQRPGNAPGGARPDREEMLKRFDKDGDGQLDETERAAVKAEFAKRRGNDAGRPGPEFLKRFDTDGDGQLDATEREAAKAAFANRQAGVRPGAGAAASRPDNGRVDKQALMKEFDTDGDGKLSGEERAAARQAFEARQKEAAKNAAGQQDGEKQAAEKDEAATDTE